MVVVSAVKKYMGVWEFIDRDAGLKSGTEHWGRLCEHLISSTCWLFYWGLKKIGQKIGKMGKGQGGNKWVKMEWWGVWL